MSQYKVNDRVVVINEDPSTGVTVVSTDLGDAGDILTHIFIDSDGISYTGVLQHFADELTSVTFVDDLDVTGLSILLHGAETKVGCYVPGTSHARQPLRLTAASRIKLTLASSGVGHIKVSVQTVTPFG